MSSSSRCSYLACSLVNLTKAYTICQGRSFDYATGPRHSVYFGWHSTTPSTNVALEVNDNSPLSILPCMSIELFVIMPAMDQQWQAGSTCEGAFVALKVPTPHIRCLLKSKDIYVEMETRLDSSWPVGPGC
jgi:hypothetical protein